MSINNIPEQQPDFERIRLLEERTVQNIGRIVAAVNGFDMKQSERNPSSYGSSTHQRTPAGALIKGQAGSYAGVGSHYGFILEIDDNQKVRFDGAYDPLFGDSCGYSVVEGGKEVIGASFNGANPLAVEGSGALQGVSTIDTIERFALDMALLAGEHGVADRDTAEGILENIRTKTAK